MSATGDVLLARAAALLWPQRARLTPPCPPRAVGAGHSYPETVPLASINRQCSSGLQAVANIAAGIKVLPAPL